MYTHKNGIRLRKVERSDLPAMLDLKQESWYGTHKVAFLNAQDQERWFEMMGGDSLYLIAEDDKFNAPTSPFGIESTDYPRVGLYKITGIDWINRSYDSAHDVFPCARGKGYGYRVLEAGVDFGFELLNMHRLDTQVLENNKASEKTALKAGFKQEGVRVGAVYKCGQWLDSMTFGLLRGDWEKLPRVVGYGGVCNVSYKPKDGR